MSDQLNHVSFDLLVKAHNGNVGKARQAWAAICQLGGFGGVPETYDGGLDTKGIGIARDEYDQGQGPFLRVTPNGQPISFMPPTTDNIKRIEDYASGDKVRR